MKNHRAQVYTCFSKGASKLIKIIELRTVNIIIAQRIMKKIKNKKEFPKGRINEKEQKKKNKS